MIGSNIITIAPDGGSAMIGSQTVKAEGSPITISSTGISLGSFRISVSSSTVALATPTHDIGGFQRLYHQALASVFGSHSKPFERVDLLSCICGIIHLDLCLDEHDMKLVYEKRNPMYITII